jgi:hypothetical protein
MLNKVQRFKEIIKDEEENLREKFEEYNFALPANL